MPEDKSAVEDFLQGLNKREKDPFKSSDPFAQIPQEESPVEEEVQEEEEAKALPFHKDPKILRFIEKEVEKRTPKTVETREFRESDDEVTSVLERIIGNDSPEKVQAVKDFRKVLGSLEEKGAARALAQLDEQARAQAAEDNRAMEELDNSLDEVEQTFNVDLSSNAPSARRTRSEFMDYIRKIAPKNEEGEVASFPDIPAAWEEFQDKRKRSAPSASRAKELASRSMTRSTDATQAPVTTDKSWKSVEKLFNKLTS